VVLLGLHLVRTILFFGSPMAVFSADPPTQVDHALHLYQGSLGSRCLLAHGVNWGYDPAFSAGVLKTPFHDPSAGLSDLAQLLAGSGYHPAAYKLMLAVTILTGPLLVLVGLVRLGLGPWETLAATAFVLLNHWGGFPVALLDSGLFGFLWACHWAIFLLGSLAEWRREPTPYRWLELTVSTSFTLFVHPTAPILLLLTLGGWYLTSALTRGFLWSLSTWCIVGVAISLNLLWILPLVSLLPWRVAQFSFMSLPADRALAGFYYVTAERPILALWLLGGLLGGFRGWLFGRAEAGRALVLALLATFSLMAFGSLFDRLRPLETLRFQVPLAMLGAIGSGWLVVGGFTDPVASRSSIRRLSGPLAAALWLGACAAAETQAGLVVRWFGERAEVARLLGEREPYPPLRLGPPPGTTLLRMLTAPRALPMGLAPEMKELAAWIESNTDGSSRILLEDQLRLREVTIPESLHWTPLLPVLVPREYIGGQYQCTPLAHHAASFGDFSLGGRAASEFTPAELKAWCDRYQIGTVIAWSESSRLAFAAAPGFEKIAELGRHATAGLKPKEERWWVFRVREPVSRFLHGKGRVVRAELNRIELADVEPDERGRVTLRYHWHDTLVTDLGQPVRRARVDGDPVGFIRLNLEKPVKRLTILNSYRFGASSATYEDD
jgi:hypothetical protein